MSMRVRRAAEVLAEKYGPIHDVKPFCSAIVGCFPDFSEQERTDVFGLVIYLAATDELKGKIEREVNDWKLEESNRKAMH